MKHSTEPVSPKTAAVLAAVFHIHSAQGRVTVRECVTATGTSVGTVHLSLKELKSYGLVDWEPGLSSTLRPTLTATAV